MRLLINILIISQVITVLSVFAEKNKKDSSKFNSLKWEKVDNKSNNFKKIIWKAYNNDDSYFQNGQLAIPVENKNNMKIKNKYFANKEKTFDNTQIEPYIPLNKFLLNGEYETRVEWKSSFDGGKSGGIGQQNNSFRVDYGLTDNALLTTYFAEADDDLYNFINGQRGQYHWQSFAISLKTNLVDSEDSKIALSLVSTIEYWLTSSGSEFSKSIYNETDDSLGKDKFGNLVGSLSLPFSRDISEKVQFVLAPGISFLPEKLGDRTNRKNFYGNSFYLGTGLVLNLSQNLNLLASYTNLLGPGNNYFDSNLNFSKKSLYSFGFDWNINPMIGLQGKITNSYGSTPSTGLLTIPSDNLPLYSANLVYRPYESDTFLKPLSKRDKLLNFGGLTVNNALIPKAKTSQIKFNYDSKGNLFGFYGYSLSNIFQLEVINIGTFKKISDTNNIDNNLKNTYLNKNNLNYRLGGKLLIFSPQKDDLFWMSLRASVGRNDDTNQGYLFSEMINTFKINDMVVLNLSPKYFFSGVDSFGGLGISTYIYLSDNLQIIPEINTSFKEGSNVNSSITFRYAYNPRKSIDLYYSNAIGVQDVGQLLENKEYKFGINLNFLY